MQAIRKDPPPLSKVYEIVSPADEMPAGLAVIVWRIPWTPKRKRLDVT